MFINKQNSYDNSTAAHATLIDRFRLKNLTVMDWQPLRKPDFTVAVLHQYSAQFPDAKPNHAVFPSEAYAMKGKKGTPGGIVASYQTDPNTPIGSSKRSWATAKKAAGVEARWQDLRHTAGSKIAAGGATDQTLMALFGWMSPKMIERYSHVREEAKMRAVKVFDNPESLEGPPKNHHSEGDSTDKPYVN